MSGLLEQSLQRILGKDGDPVIQLKTAFGGGKTHSMLALYHMMRGRIAADRIPAITPILDRVGVATLPKANVAVIVGTALDPTKSKRPPYMPGITIRTVWGEIAAQLAESTGEPGLYDYVREADRKSVSPGSEALRNLFDAAGPCLILMDEVIAYAKKIYGARDLPAGTFDNFVAFIQELTEAVRASKNSLVVAAIPESDIEIGGEAGQTALRTIEHCFGRLEAIWKPVAASEGFEVVRRRLFLDCKDTAKRDAVCASFSRMYNDNQGDFPLEAKEVEYKERLISCYPIHPEVFDRLYEDWATMERFQRTRGVLRLMAAVIHELWMGNDASLMIMPGSIPLDVPNVRDELTRNLSEGWNAIVDREVDGKNAIPYQLDQANPRYGSRLAARRVARTIMLGSAPSVRNQSVRGVEASRIRLGVVQPGESIAQFNDALNSLTSSLAYLYTNPSRDRYWYDTRPTLRKTVSDRATQITSPAVEHEIESRLGRLRKEDPFAGIHICPASSHDVPDEQVARLVILRPTDEYKRSSPSSSALTAALDILDTRGNGPRIYRNMLAFIAPDEGSMSLLQESVRQYLAWQSVKNDSEVLNLDASQNRETANSLQRSSAIVDAQIKETYCWLLVPYTDKDVSLKETLWDVTRISGGTEGAIGNAAARMLQNEFIITQWAPVLLLMELNNLLWRESDHIQIRDLWDKLCRYSYLPRLANQRVLHSTIQTGVDSVEYFAFAAGFDGSRYIDLKYNQPLSVVEPSGYLVRVDVAMRQVQEEAARLQSEAGTEAGDPLMEVAATGDESFSGLGSLTGPGKGSGAIEETGPAPRDTHFFMTAALDTTRIGRDVERLVNEVVNHLIATDDCKVEISLEVNATSAKGLPQSVIRTVSENCHTLGVEFGFDEEGEMGDL